MVGETLNIFLVTGSLKCLCFGKHQFFPTDWNFKTERYFHQEQISSRQGIKLYSLYFIRTIFSLKILILLPPILAFTISNCWQFPGVTLKVALPQSRAFGKIVTVTVTVTVINGHSAYLCRGGFNKHVKYWPTECKFGVCLLFVAILLVVKCLFSLCIDVFPSAYLHVIICFIRFWILLWPFYFSAHVQITTNLQLMVLELSQ